MTKTRPAKDRTKAKPGADGPDTSPTAPGKADAPPSGTGEYRVLARKYRPSTFEELIGQDALVRTLTNAITLGRVAHAFLLTGVRGIGKTTTARIIARALNCVGPDGKGGPTPEPCGVCDFCTSIAADRNVDVTEMDAASSAGVNDIRELIDGVRYKPLSARYKIYIIDEVHMLSKQAFDALLKTLEEPPEHVKFVFATTEIRKVPVTVLSRCQRFDLQRLDQDVMATHLAEIAAAENAQIAEPAMALLARAADGSVRDGLSLLDQVIAQRGADQDVTAEEVRAMLGLADRSQVLDLLHLVMKGDIKAALEQAAAMYKAGADPVVVLQDLLDVTHWLTRLKIVPDAAEGAAVSDAVRKRAQEMAEALSMPVLTRAWQMLLKGFGEVQTAPRPLTALEMLLVRMAYAAELPAPADVIAALDREAPSDGQNAASIGGPSPKTTPTQSSRPPGPQTAPPAPPPNRATESAVESKAPPPPEASSSAQPATALAAQVEPEEPAPIPGGAPEPAVQANGGPKPQPRTFEQVVDLVAERREGILHSHLVASVHLVAFEAGRIEFRPNDEAPRELANRLGELLTEWTGERWVVAISQAPGEATLREQRAEVDAQQKQAVTQDSLVRAVLDAFPGSVIESVRDLPARNTDQPESPQPPGDADGDHETKTQREPE